MSDSCLFGYYREYIPSLVFEKNVLMADDVKLTVQQTLLTLEEMANEDEDDTFASFLLKFTPRDEDRFVALV